MFTQAMQIPAHNLGYANGCAPCDVNCYTGWNGQPVISGGIQQNDLFGCHNNIAAGDFFGVNNHFPARSAVNCGVNYGAPLGIHAYNAFQGAGWGHAAQGQFQPTNLMGRGTLCGHFLSMGCPVYILDNDTEVCYECLSTGLSSNNLDICIANGEIRVSSGAGNGSRSGSSRSATTNGVRTLVCCLPLPSFCDAAKCSAKVVQGRLLITCPRTAEYVKTITRVKVS